jgi:hypothetical protein
MMAGTWAHVQKKSIVGRLLGALPRWVVHLGSNRFLDSDLAFIHYQVC